jgi:adenylate cyclase
LLRGINFCCFNLTRETNLQARQHFEQAVALDPQYAEAYALLVMTYVRGAFYYQEGQVRVRERALELARKAVALDDTLALAHNVLGWAYFLHESREQALIEGRRAIALAPNDADFHAELAKMILWAPVMLGGLGGGQEEALKLLEKASRLNPRYQTQYSVHRGLIFLSKGELEKAIEAFKGALNQTLLNPHALILLEARLNLAVAYLEAGRQKEAHTEAEEFLQLKPDFNLEGLKEKRYKNAADLLTALDTQYKAGVREFFCGC